MIIPLVFPPHQDQQPQVISIPSYFLCGPRAPPSTLAHHIIIISSSSSTILSTIITIVIIAMRNLLWRHPAESGRGSLEEWWSSLCLWKIFISRVGNVELLMVSFLGKVCSANWCVVHTSMMWRWLLKIQLQTQSKMMMLHWLSFKHLSVIFFYLLYIENFNLKYNIQTRWAPHIRRRGGGPWGHCWCHV